MKRIGIYNPYIESKGGGEKICLALAETLANHPNAEVTLITHKAVSLEHLGHYFQIDTSRIKCKIINFETIGMKILNRLPLPGSFRSLFYDVKTLRAIKNSQYDIFINNCYQSNLPNPSQYGVYMCMFPQKIKGNQEVNISVLKGVYRFGLRNLSRLVLNPTKKHAVYSYDIITANSAYTQGYIKDYWGVGSSILYPFGEDMLDAESGDKEKTIVHVGRFFENIGESHNKRQDFMVEVFKDLPELHQNGWELHFIGSVAEDVGALRFILDLIRDASGYPIYFHFNSSFTDLKKLYNEASIYWHATGYGSDPKKHPEKQEHFGISTVEAMSAKAIPIVINTAGQKESVIDGQNGFLWKTADGFKAKTLQVARLKPQAQTELRTAARDGFHRFDKSGFQASVNEIFADIL